MPSLLKDLWDDLGHIVVETRVGGITAVASADDASPPALRTDFNPFTNTLRHERQTAHLKGPVLAIHRTDQALSDEVRRQWPRLLRRFARVDAQAEALPDEETP